MEWKLNDTRKKEYDSMLSSARDLESNIGSSQYRIQRLLDMRSEIDNTIKLWWDNLIKEMSLPDNRDYIITHDGVIKDVTKEPAKEPAKTETKVGTNAADLA
jgi:hypothetical protein